MNSRKEVDEAAAYAEAVRSALSDVSPEDRSNLLGDLEAHLAEVAAEPGATLTERLGSPQDYAAELRAAYGDQAGAVRCRPRRWGLAYLLAPVPVVIGVLFAAELIAASRGVGVHWFYLVWLCIALLVLAGALATLVAVFRRVLDRLSPRSPAA